MILTNAILEYIFLNLGMMDERNNSILSSKLLTDKTITFDDAGKEQQYHVYACQTSIGQSKITMAGTKLNYDDNTKDMVVVVKMEDCPIYGCYISQNNKTVEDGIIAFSIKNNVWLSASVFIQASFLAGMEQLKDVIIPFDVCNKPQEIYDILVSFLKYRDTLNEG